MDVGVLTVVCVTVTAMAVRALVRLVRRSASLQSVGAAALVMWVALAGVCWFVEIRHQWVQSVATGVVQEISGNPEASAACMRRTVDFVDPSRYSGRVDWDQPTVAVLRAGVCVDLAGWLAGPKTAPTVAQAEAVHVLVHEAVHVTGETDEAVTECTALALDAHAAELLGASPDGAAALADVYLTQVYPFMPSEYRMDCSTVPAPQVGG